MTKATAVVGSRLAETGTFRVVSDWMPFVHHARGRRGCVLELQWLRSFVVLSELLHFGRSGAALNLSQSALSVQMRKLEQHLGTQLLIRDRRSVRLTRAGDNLLRNSQRILSDLGGAERQAKQTGDGVRGHLRLGFVSTAATEFMPGIVRFYRSKHPDVVLSLQNLRTTDQIEALLRQQVDIAFLRLPVTVEELEIALIASEPFRCFLPKDHRLAGRSEVDLVQLKYDPFFLYDRSKAPGFSDRILSICLNAGFSPQMTQNASEMQTILSMINAGLGVSILPKSAAALGSMHLINLPLVGCNVNSELGIAYLRSTTPDPLVLHFVSEIKQLLSQENDINEEK